MARPKGSKNKGKTAKQRREESQDAARETIKQRLSKATGSGTVEAMTFLGLTVTYRYTAVNFFTDIIGAMAKATGNVGFYDALQEQQQRNLEQITGEVKLLNLPGYVMDQLKKEAEEVVRKKYEEQLAVVDREIERAEEQLRLADEPHREGVEGMLEQLYKARDDLHRKIGEISGDSEDVRKEWTAKAELLSWCLAMGMAGCTIMLLKEVSTSEIMGTLADLVPLT